MSIGRLRRNLDIGLINKIKSGWKPAGKTLARKSGGVTTPRSASSYHAARRNQVIRIDNGVWGTAAHYQTPVLAKYVPTEPKGTSAAVTMAGERNPGIRMIRRCYKPNGAREVARRLARIAA